MVLMVHRVVRVKTKTLQAGSRGFTLIELLIVSTLIVVFLSIVFINAGKLYDKFVLRESCLTLVRTLNSARIISITERIPVILKVDSETSSYWLEIPSEKLRERLRLRKISLREGLTIEGEDILFSPSGDNTGGSIRIKDRNGSYYHITIDSTTSKVSVRTAKG
mgnify:CR=1 FL=1